MTNQRFTEENIINKIIDAFSTLDEHRRIGLERAKELHQIKNSALEMERIRLVKKYGENHPRVKEADERLAYNSRLLKDLDYEIERSGIVVQPFDANSWRVHGRVLNEKKIPVKGLTVSLFDENGNWVRETGYSGTGKDGYFSITYPVKAKENSIPETQKLFLTITDNKQIIYQSDEPLYIYPGLIDYQDIIISGKREEPPREPYVKGIPKNTWIVRGRIVDKKENPAEGLTISLFDKESLFVDVLGTRMTDSQGLFEFKFRSEELKELIEKKSDIFLKVSDNTGKIFYKSRKPIRCESGREEVFEKIVVKS